MQSARDNKQQLNSLVGGSGTARKILSFWRDIEFFRPFDLDRVIDSGRSLALFSSNAAPLPWENRELYKLKPELEYGFDIFLAPFQKSELIRALSAKFPAILKDELSDPRALEGLSCFLRVSLDDTGSQFLDDLGVSTLPWAIESVISGAELSLSAFDMFGEGVREVVGLARPKSGDTEQQSESSQSKSAPFDLTDLIAFAERVTAGYSINFFPQQLLGVVVWYPLRKRKNPDSDSENDVELSAQDRDDSTSEQEATRQDTLSLRDILRKKRKVDILNSFFLRDLERASKPITKAQASISTPFSDFLRGASESEFNRIDLLKSASNNSFVEFLKLESQPLARWPAPSSESATLSQQLVLNRYFSSTDTLHAVNGPPGTGKTYLVRDVLAELVHRRAAALARLARPGQAFVGDFIKFRLGRKELAYRKLTPELRGYELVLASSNNVAVENISKSLPKLSSIGEEFGFPQYLSSVANFYHLIESGNSNQALTTAQDTNESKIALLGHSREQTSWGLPSVALGRARNRSLFVQAAFKGRKVTSEQEDQLRKKEIIATLFEWRKRAPKAGITSSALSFHAAKRAFLSAESYVRKQQSAHLEQLPQSELELLAQLKYSAASSQLASFFASSSLNSARSELFLASLELHQAWLREVPQFERELFAISSLLSSPGSVDTEHAEDIWPLLFMITPLVSTTLASVERMFAGLGAGSIGHLIIDEAGQATPQAVVGALYRAKSAIFLGDQRQLEPISQIPQTLERFAAERNEISADLFDRISPLSSSAQSLADRQSELGTTYGNSPFDAWVGVPLCVHRRCHEPMFSISNSIAYDNQMITSLAGSEPQPLAGLQKLGASAWLHCIGEVSGKHWVPEQGRVCLALLESALAHSLECNQSFPDLFFISPFREVRQKLHTLLKPVIEGHEERFPKLHTELRRRIGTVHTFQGKEAAAVVFVLGCDQSSVRAADWAGERPNLVNVAVTRARMNLFVVGDANLWHNRGFFSDLEKSLKKVDAREIFGDATRQSLT